MPIEDLVERDTAAASCHMGADRGATSLVEVYILVVVEKAGIEAALEGVECCNRSVGRQQGPLQTESSISHEFVVVSQTAWPVIIFSKRQLTHSASR